MKTRIVRKFDFHAAHRLLTFPEGHKCRRMHGHTYQCEIVLEGELDPAVGYFIDFGDLKAVLGPLEAQLDHAYLNDIDGLAVPTTEVLAAWIFDRLRPAAATGDGAVVRDGGQRRGIHRRLTWP